MNPVLFILLGLFLSLTTRAQSTFDWKGQRQLQLTDFQTQITGQTDAERLSTSIGLGFNLDKKKARRGKLIRSTRATFDPVDAMIVAPDTTRLLELLAFARYEFDLTELYARKYRQQLVSSRKDLKEKFVPISVAIRTEYEARLEKDTEQTQLGKDQGVLQTLQQQVRDEIALLSRFRKSS